MVKTTLVVLALAAVYFGTPPAVAGFDAQTTKEIAMAALVALLVMPWVARQFD